MDGNRVVGEDGRESCRWTLALSSSVVVKSRSWELKVY